MSQMGQRGLFQVGEKIEVTGVVERVVFHNEENGFTVLRVVPENAEGRPLDALACVGYAGNPREGARYKLVGEIVKNPRYGRQLSFEALEEIMPASREDIRQYLASGLISGVGPEMAARIVDKFGADTLRVLDDEPEKLLGVRGIGKRSLARIREAWLKHRGMRDLMLFLRPHGVSAAYGARIYRAYGQEAAEIVRANPYRMAMDIRGVGFATADSIASKLGFSSDHPLRLQAAALYLLQKAGDDGHVFLPENELVEKICDLTDGAPERAKKAIDELERDSRVVVEGFGDEPAGVYLKRFHHCESKIAYYLRRILNSPKSARFPELDKTLTEVFKAMPFTLAPEQEKAVRQAAQAKILVVTGGPGTGKTTIINAIIKLFDAAGAKTLLAAPTGRAAKRMAETSGRDARTIHRLLEYSPKEDGFGRNEDKPLACGLLVVDEASMMDTLLFYYLLKAVPLGATVVLVGDSHQLPSVGPGNVLGDILDSGVAPAVRLNEIFRQSAESEIICSAHLINNGQMPMMERNPNKQSDFYFIARDDPEEAADLMVDLIKNHIPRRFGFDPVNDVQLLTPMRKGAVGAENMNAKLQAALNPNGVELRRGDRAYRLRDKVMQVRNNYDKDIFNGDIGRVVYLNPRERQLSVDFDGLIIPYEFDELDELVPAYAISVHKSQGSEYPAVVIPVMIQHYPLLQRNLVYTGVTRGKKLVVLVGETRALQMAVRNNKTSKRNTWLARRLQSAD